MYGPLMWGTGSKECLQYVWTGIGWPLYSHRDLEIKLKYITPNDETY